MAFGQPNYYPYQSQYYNPTPTYQQPTISYQTPAQQVNFPQQQTLYGKIVDSIDVVKAIDLPLSQTGVYPKADGTEIFVKSWMPDGTTKVEEYQKISSSTQDGSNINRFDEIVNQIQLLSKKIDEMKPFSSKKHRVEVDEDDE